MTRKKRCMIRKIVLTRNIIEKIQLFNVFLPMAKIIYCLIWTWNYMKCCFQVICFSFIIWTKLLFLRHVFPLYTSYWVLSTCKKYYIYLLFHFEGSFKSFYVSMTVSGECIKMNCFLFLFEQISASSVGLIKY